VQLDDLSGPQPRLISEQLGEVADVAPRASIAQRRAEDGPVTTRSPRQPEQQLHRGGLPGAVGAEETEDLTRLDAQGEVDQRISVAVALRETVGVDDRSVGRRFGHRRSETAVRVEA
jgi:hypothetical protein